MEKQNAMDRRFHSYPAKIQRAHNARHMGAPPPMKNKKYKGFIVFAVGCFGSDPLNPTPLQCEFGSLDSSPWFHDELMEFLRDLKTKEGGVYRWEGTFRNHEFVGKFRQLKLT